jgi:hypothetical protein
MVDNPEPTSFENIHRYLRSHHRQMVDDAETTSFENIHRVAAVATGRRCETHEKISPALSIARWWMTQNRRPSKTSTAWSQWLPDVCVNRKKKSHRSQSPDRKESQPVRNSFRLALRSPSIHEGGKLIRQTIA